ncbi:MAG: RNA polymerase sigma factor [bacterium]
METTARNERDEGLIQRFAAGDEAAFHAFFALHDPSLRRYVRSMVSSGAVVDDILQETWMAVLSAAESFQPGNARGWLFSIARRHTARHFRKRAGEPSQMETLETLGLNAGWGQSFGDDLAAAHDLRKALAHLDEDTREILVLRDVEGFTNEEAAEALGLSLPATKSRLHRARLALMAELTPEVNHA